MGGLFGWIAARTPEQWSALSAFGTVLTALVAIAATIFAWQQVRHARELREEQARPFVVVLFRPSRISRQWINLVVENIGNTVARNVRISFDQPLESAARSRNINNAKLFKEGVPAMPPGMRFETLFDQCPQRKDSALPMTYRAKVSYDNVRGRRETEQYILDMEIFFGLESFVEYGLHDVAKSLREMNKTLKG